VIYGKIHVRQENFIYRKKKKTIKIFSYLVKAMGRIEEIRTKRERHHIMKR